MRRGPTASMEFAILAGFGPARGMRRPPWLGRIAWVSTFGRFDVLHGHGGPGRPAPGSADKRFDLLFLTLSGALVFFPYLSYGLLQRPRRLRGHREPDRGPLRDRPRGRPPHVLDVPANGPGAAVPPALRPPGLPAPRADPDPRHPRRALRLPAASDRLLPLGVAPRHAPGPVHLGDLPDARRRAGPRARPLARRRRHPRRALPDGDVQVRRGPVRARRRARCSSRRS